MPKLVKVAKYRDCNVKEYESEGDFPTCGDTRAWKQNWGTAIDKVKP